MKSKCTKNAVISLYVNEKDTLQHFQIRENRIRTFVVSVFDLMSMSLLYVMNSPIPLCIYVLQKLNGEWREEKKV